MQRGEVWDYDPVIRREGRPTRRLILSTDGWNADPEHRVVTGALVFGEDLGGLVNVGTRYGWVSVPTVEPILRSRLTTLVGALDVDELSAVDNALRGYLDL